MTYTIVARDLERGEIGIASQSHYFALGNVVPWIQSGVGAVATQSFVDPSYGPLGLARLAAGDSAADSLAALVAADPGRDRRQVACMPVAGPPAAYTGSGCVQPAGHVVARDHVAMGNMLTNADVWPAISVAYTTTEGDLATRMLAGLAAGQAAGGDARGMQSAALKVCRIADVGEPWGDALVDLRVDDHTDPIGELGRLLGLARAYDQIAGVLFDPELLADHGTSSPSSVDAADEALGQAAAVLGGNVEALMWRAVLRAKYGRPGAGDDIAAAFAAHPPLRGFVAQLAAAGVLDEATYRRLTAVTNEGIDR